MTTPGKMIRDALAAHGWDQRTMAIVRAWSESKVSRMISDETQMSAADALIVAEVLPELSAPDTKTLDMFPGLPPVKRERTRRETIQAYGQQLKEYLHANYRLVDGWRWVQKDGRLADNCDGSGVLPARKAKR